jgi:hypothetical protein
MGSDVSSVKRVWKGGGGRAELVLGRTRQGSSATTHWPTLVRTAQSEPGGFPRANQALASHVQGYTAGMAFLLSVTGRKVRYIDSLVIVLGSSSPYVNNSHAFTRRRNEIGSSLFA